jgi:hypothetical protein
MTHAQGMWATRLLYVGLGLFFVGWALLIVAIGLGHDDSLALRIALLMPYLGFVALLLAGLCALLAGVRRAGRMVVATARRRPGR